MSGRPSFALKRDHPRALYAQIADWLEQEIASGGLRPGARIEGENALARKLEVSRVTVRQALEALVARGLLLRRQGKGTFVAGSVIRHDLRSPHGVFDTLHTHGIRPAATLVDFREDRPPERVAELMRLGTGERGVRLVRLYLSGERPIGFGEGWLAPEAKVLTREEAGSTSTAALFRDRLAIEIARTAMSFGAKFAGTRGGELLGIPATRPVMRLTRTAFEPGGRAVEVLDFTINSEAFEFTLVADGRISVTSGLRTAA